MPTGGEPAAGTTGSHERAANRPGAAFTKRASFPLVAIARDAVGNVASGVLPPDEDQSFFAAIASTIALQLIGSPQSRSTSTAASIWLSFLVGVAGCPFAFVAFFAENAWRGLARPSPSSSSWSSSSFSVYRVI